MQLAGTGLRHFGPGGKRLYPSCDLASCTDGACLSAYQSTHSIAPDVPTGLTRSAPQGRLTVRGFRPARAVGTSGATRRVCGPWSLALVVRCRGRSLLRLGVTFIPMAAWTSPDTSGVSSKYTLVVYAGTYVSLRRGPVATRLLAPAQLPNPLDLRRFRLHVSQRLPWCFCSQHRPTGCSLTHVAAPVNPYDVISLASSGRRLNCPVPAAQTPSSPCRPGWEIWCRLVSC